MKGKVYRRNINPSIHQPRAAAKDLISSGASKHGVLSDKLYRRGMKGEKADARVQGAPGKNSHSSPPSPRALTSEILSPTCRQIYLSVKNAASRGHVASIVACLGENRINTSINGAPRGTAAFLPPAAGASLQSYARYSSGAYRHLYRGAVFEETVPHFLRLAPAR